MSGRKTKLVIIPEKKKGEPDNRDAGKIYSLKEMPASQAEWWALRAWHALARAGVEYPPSLVGLGMVGLAFVLFDAMRHATPVEIEPLWVEMFNCVRMVPNPNNTETTRPLVENDIEEVMTRLQLRKEILELHVGFSLAELASRLTSSAKSVNSSLSPTPTSPDLSEA